MNWGLRLQRLRADIAGELVAKGAALFGVLLIFLGLQLDDDASVIEFGGGLVAVSLVWIVFKILRANTRRDRLAKSLITALAAHGEAAAGSDAFPDIPFWVGRDHIYCAGETEIEAQPLDRLVWTYAEAFLIFGFFRRYQLALWNRDAVATVLPVSKRFRDAALNRIRQAAPWMPVGYSISMKESWNSDHAELLALVDSHRQANKRFEAPWAGNEVVFVLLDSQRARTDPVHGLSESKEKAELKKLAQRWAKDEN
jgi:hypothetical protein